jgi:hypothetical protein
MPVDLTIHPREGMGALRFGMSPQEVVRAEPALGPPHRSKPRHDGSLREFRGLGAPSLGFVNDRLNDIECPADTPGVRFEDLQVFEADPRAVLHRLSERNGGALIGLGSVLFVNLGINTGGFYNTDNKRFFNPAFDLEDNRTIDVFAPGAFDDLLDEFEPFSLPSA